MVKEKEMNWQNKKIINEVKQEIDSFLKKKFFLLGDYTKCFQESFAKSQNVKYFMGLSSGTVALQLLLRALQLSKGSKVLVSSFCPIPTIMSIYEAGYIPKFVDINVKTLNIDISNLEKSYDTDCQAVIAVHIFGKLCKMSDISLWCKTKGLLLVEDACQAVNSNHKDFSIAEHSLGAAMSFYPTKNLGAWGDAGGILTNDELLKNKINYLRNYGLNESFESESMGGNYRIDELQAMILLKKLPLQAQDMKNRDSILDFYIKSLGIDKLQMEKDEGYHNKHVISYLLESSVDREKYRTFCKENGLKESFFYEHPIYKEKGIEKGAFLKNCEDVCSRIINLPNNNKNQKVVSFLKEL